MAKRKRRKFTAELKAESVRLSRELGNINQVERDLDVHPSTLSRWIAEAEADERRGPWGALTGSEDPTWRDQLHRWSDTPTTCVDPFLQRRLSLWGTYLPSAVSERRCYRSVAGACFAGTESPNH